MSCARMALKNISYVFVRQATEQQISLIKKVVYLLVNNFNQFFKRRLK